MNKDFLETARKAVEEKWDAWRIMAEFISLQKEVDAKLCEENGQQEMAEKIRQQ